MIVSDSPLLLLPLLHLLALLLLPLFPLPLLLLLLLIFLLILSLLLPRFLSFTLSIPFFPFSFSFSFSLKKNCRNFLPMKLILSHHSLASLPLNQPLFLFSPTAPASFADARPSPVRSPLWSRRDLPHDFARHRTLLAISRLSRASH